MAAAGGPFTEPSDCNGEIRAMDTTYEEIMGMEPSSSGESEAGGGSLALSSRLASFRDWLSEQAEVTVHPSICIVNGEATDGTKNAPVLVFGPPPSAVSNQSNASKSLNGAGRCGMVDSTAEQALYDRTMGCQVRTVKEIKKDEVMMTVPRSAMITPDLIASSDAGKAVLACCEPLASDRQSEFWDAFENTTVCEKKFAEKVARNNGTQLLVKILQERKKAETVLTKAFGTADEISNSEDRNGGECPHKLVEAGTLSTRAPLLALLIHQRFSNHASPPIVSENGRTEVEKISSALRSARPLKPPIDSPRTFGPYARTLPAAVSLPICWKRNELALLAGCIPGIPPLQDVAARTLQLASEFIALVEAGITHRFPSIFPRGMITWERWVWAAAVFTSRVLPVSCYLNKNDSTAVSHCEYNHKKEQEIIQSSPEVWDELGVMIPLLDMLNHESEASQVLWQPCVPDSSAEFSESVRIESLKNDELAANSPSGTLPNDEVMEEEVHPPRAVMSKRVKKGSQVYCNYGVMSNQHMILQYGFAQMNNTADDVKIGWGLTDAVGNVAAPIDYAPPFAETATENSTDFRIAPKKGNVDLVYESSDTDCINAWWNEARLALLESEALVSDSFVAMLKSGKKMTAVAYGDGTYHPILLTAAVVGTMPPSEVNKCTTKEGGKSGKNEGIALTRKHQQILRSYLGFVFARKMEKLLQSLNNGLKDHFNNVQLWTKVTHGGLHYSEGEQPSDGVPCHGWQSFFDSHAYSATMEVEKRYYAMGPDSCVLTLYDGHLRSLQVSIDGVATDEKFEKGVLRQLEELGFVILHNDVEDDKVLDRVGDNSKGDNVEVANGRQKEPTKEIGEASGKGKRRRNRRKGDRPPAVKLHIGNLAYTTGPADLFDFFANMYGRENVLECHIPTERESGRSRGFGFVTMPDSIAMKALHSGRKHEIGGRLLKVAESNSAGTGKSSRGGSSGGAVAPSDRCSSCGYRPRYCVCAVAERSGYGLGPSGPTGSSYYGEDYRPLGDYVGPYRDSGGQEFHGSRHRNDRSKGSYSRSHSHHRDSGRVHRDIESRREHDRDYRDYRQTRSRSRSFSRGRDRDKERSRRERDRRRGRERSRDRSGERSQEGRGTSRRKSRSRGSSRGWEGRSSRHSRSGERSRSYSGGRQSRRERKGNDVDTDVRPATQRTRSLSRSVSPIGPRGGISGAGNDRKREGSDRKRSRSRSRGKSGKRKRSNKKDGSRRHGRSRSGTPTVGRSRGERVKL